MEMASLCVLNLMMLHERYFHNGAVLKYKKDIDIQDRAERLAYHLFS